MADGGRHEGGYVQLREVLLQVTEVDHAVHLEGGRGEEEGGGERVRGCMLGEGG